MLQFLTAEEVAVLTEVSIPISQRQWAWRAQLELTISVSPMNLRIWDCSGIV